MNRARPRNIRTVLSRQLQPICHQIATHSVKTTPKVLRLEPELLAAGLCALLCERCYRERGDDRGGLAPLLHLRGGIGKLEKLPAGMGPAQRAAQRLKLLHHAIVIQIDGSSFRLRRHADLLPEHIRSNTRITPPAPVEPRRRGRLPKNGGAAQTPDHPNRKVGNFTVPLKWPGSSGTNIPLGVTWNGAGGCVISSQSRQENFSRTVWMTARQQLGWPVGSVVWTDRRDWRSPNRRADQTIDGGL